MMWNRPDIFLLLLVFVPSLVVPCAFSSHLPPSEGSEGLGFDHDRTSSWTDLLAEPEHGADSMANHARQDGLNDPGALIRRQEQMQRPAEIEASGHKEALSKGFLNFLLKKWSSPLLKHRTHSSSLLPFNLSSFATTLEKISSTYELLTLDRASNSTPTSWLRRQLLRFHHASLRSRLQRSSRVKREQALAALQSSQVPLDASEGNQAAFVLPKKAAKMARRPSKRTVACSGPCCTSSPPTVPAGVPTMPSQWISNIPPDGAQVQVRSFNWGTWWAPLGGKWNGEVGATKWQPPSTVFLKVIRVSATQIRLRTPSGTYIRAGNFYAHLNYGDTFSLDTTTVASDPATVLTIIPSTFKPNCVVIQCYDGLVLSAPSPNGTQILRWGTSAKDWEQWQFQEIMTIPKIRGVNLGSWLVYENWMDPAAFPNKSALVDSTLFTLQSVATGNYVSTVYQGMRVALPTSSYYEPFSLRTTRFANTYQFRSTWYLNLWRVSGKSAIVADSIVEGGKGLENFQLYFPSAAISASLSFSVPPVLIRALSNGKFLRASSSGDLVADVSLKSINVKSLSVWTSAVAFWFNATSSQSGEWQLAHTLGRAAPAAFRSRWSSWINESDWAYLASQKINAVRIPIGYWLTQGAKPDAPFVSGGAAFLDWAFAMGNKYSIRIWISMHSVPQSQSGQQASAPRESLALWHLIPGNLNKTVAAVGWIAKRYASDPAWLGIGLVNEPTSAVPLTFLQSYWTASYYAVRQYSKCAFISMEGRQNPWEARWTNQDPFFTNLIVETHIYDVFRPDLFNGKDAKYEIEYMRVNRTQQFKDFGTSGRMLLIGEFSNAMAWPNYTDGDKTQNQFSLVQMKTMAAAQAGWFFWSYKTASKNVGAHWDFRWSTHHGWLPKKKNGNWY